VATLNKIQAVLNALPTIIFLKAFTFSKEIIWYPRISISSCKIESKKGIIHKINTARK
jgi:hypothetical protein